MIDLELNYKGSKKLFTYPESWEEVTVGKYTKLMMVDDTLPNIQKRLQIVNIITDIPMEILLNMNSTVFSELEESINFVQEEVSESTCEYIEIGKDKYYLYKDFQEFTMGEQISIDMLVQESGGNLLKVYNKLLCIFLRKKDRKGVIEDFDSSFLKRTEIFDEAPISKVNSLLLFFSSGKP